MSPSPLKILQVVSSSATSGAERHCVDLAKLLQASGHQVEVACPPDNWMTKELAEAGIPTHGIDFKAMKGLRSLRDLYKILPKGRFDVIHSHLSRAAYATWATGTVRGVPIVSTVHVMTGEPVYRLMSRKTNRIVAVSGFIRETLLASGVKDRYIDVVYNGTDFADKEYEAQAPVHEELEVPHSREMVALIGRVCREKGHDIAVEAFPDVLAAHPETQLVFVGRTEGAFPDDLRRRADQLGVLPHITFTGNRNDVARLIDAASFTILPSSMEACPLAALESMARGRPLVASRVGGLKELVLHEKTGLLVEQNASELAGGMASMLESRDRREEMGENARQWIQERFTVAQMLERLEAVYEHAAGR